MASNEISDRKSLDPDLIRHMILGSLASYRKRHRKTYGELVICCDGMESWRKDTFPQYKKNRKKSRDKSKVDWKMLYKVMDEMKVGLKTCFPYLVYEYEHAEADDIIAYYVKEFEGPHLIVSGDKDFIQLLRDDVSILKPSTKELIEFNSEGYSKKEINSTILDHILRGDSTDGIPNVISPDDIFLQEGKKQRPFTKKRKEEFTEAYRDGLKDNYEHYENFLRNKSMILLDRKTIPDYVWEGIDSVVEETEVQGDMKSVRDFMIEYRLRNLSERIEDFV